MTITRRAAHPSEIKTPAPPWMPKMVKASEVEPAEIEWLWHPYIPRKTTTLLYGPGGMGKSWISCSIAADLSAGRALPGQEALPHQKIVIISAEDDPREVLAPRLMALGANRDNIIFVPEAFSLDTRGLQGLEEVLKASDAAILFLDPLVAYLGGKMDINKANEARAIMGPLADIARRTNSAIVVVHHTRKGKEGSAADRAMGSADFTNSVRSGLLVDQTEAGSHFMRHAKANWSMKAPALSYSVTDNIFHWGPQLAGHEAIGVSTTPMKNKQAVEFLKELLRDGRKPVEEIISKAKIMGLPERTLERAKKGIAKSVRDTDKWYWELEEGVRETGEPVVVKKDPIADILLRARALARSKANG